MACSRGFDVLKRIEHCTRPEHCSECGDLAEKRISRFNFTNAGDWKPTYNPAFGEVVRSKAHQREILARFKDQGREMVEIGNEPVENIRKAAEAERKRKRDEIWNEPTEKILKEVLG